MGNGESIDCDPPQLLGPNNGVTLKFLIGMVTGVVLTLAVVAGFVYLPAGHLIRIPDCHAEDSCTPDYHNGDWSITLDEN